LLPPEKLRLLVKRTKQEKGEKQQQQQEGEQEAQQEKLVLAGPNEKPEEKNTHRTFPHTKKNWITRVKRTRRRRNPTSTVTIYTVMMNNRDFIHIS
jgi:hypothetical protein